MVDQTQLEKEVKLFIDLANQLKHEMTAYAEVQYKEISQLRIKNPVKFNERAASFSEQYKNHGIIHNEWLRLAKITDKEAYEKAVRKMDFEKLKNAANDFYKYLKLDIKPREGKAKQAFEDMKLRCLKLVTQIDKLKDQVIIKLDRDNLNDSQHRMGH